MFRDGEEHPVTFYSRKLKPAELEGLIVVSSVQHFTVYLHGVHFSIETDHRALSFLNSSKHQNSRLARWALQLQAYDFTIKYCSGSKNQNADALSRFSSDLDADLRSLEFPGGGWEDVGGVLGGDVGGGGVLCHAHHDKEHCHKQETCILVYHNLCNLLSSSFSLFYFTPLTLLHWNIHTTL